MKDSNRVVRQAMRFLIVGVVATLLHWGTYTLIKILFHLREADDWELTVAYSAGYAVSLLVNFQLSLRYTFHTRGNLGKGMGFVFSHAVNYGLHIVLLNLFLWIGAGHLMVRVLHATSPRLIHAVPLLGDPTVLVPLPVFVIVVPINFLLVRFFLTHGEDASVRAKETESDIPPDKHTHPEKMRVSGNTMRREKETDSDKVRNAPCITQGVSFRL